MRRRASALFVETQKKRKTRLMVLMLAIKCGNNLSKLAVGLLWGGASALPPGFRPAFSGNRNRSGNRKGYFVTSPKTDVSRNAFTGARPDC
jgi:hypothetical protein